MATLVEKRYVGIIKAKFSFGHRLVLRIQNKCVFYVGRSLAAI
jgi:hypothetical protein